MEPKTWVECGTCGLRAEGAAAAEHPVCPGRGDAHCGGEWARLCEVLEARAAECDGECAVKSGRFCAACVKQPVVRDLVAEDGLARLEAACAARPEPPLLADLVRTLEGVVIECLDPWGAPLPDAIDALKIARRDREIRRLTFNALVQPKHHAGFDGKWPAVADADAVPAHLDTSQYLGLGADRRLPRAVDARTTIDQAPPAEVLAELRMQAETSEAYRRSDTDAIAQALGMKGRPAGLGDVEWQACIEERAEALVRLKNDVEAFLNDLDGTRLKVHLTTLRRALADA